MTAVHGGRIFQFARESAHDVFDVRDFSANINPFGPPPFVVRAIEAALPLIRHYPDESHAAVKQALADRLSVSRDRLVCGNGAIEVMELVLRALAPRRVFILEPAFSEYAALAARCGAAVQRLFAAFEPGAGAPPIPVPDGVGAGDVVVVNNPHNPTGMRWTAEQWEAAAAQWETRGAFTLFDESFIDFLDDAPQCTALQKEDLSGRRIVVRSLTKIYAIPGLRFGYAVSPKDIAARIESNRDPWSVNVLAEAAAKAALGEGFGFERGTRERMREERAFVRGSWGAHPAIALHEPYANFFLARFASPSCASCIVQEAAERGAMLRECSSFAGLDGAHLRVAIRQHADNAWLWDLVAGLLDSRAECR